MPADGQLHVAFINVGQGDCTLIQCPNGLRVLIDAGSSKWRSEGDLDPDDPDLIIDGVVIDRGYYAAQVRQFLQGEPLDILILTHNDQDHYNMVELMLAGIQVDYVYHSNAIANYDNTSFRRWLATGLYHRHNVQQVTLNPATPPGPPITICDGTQAGGRPCTIDVLASDVSVGHNARFDSHEKNTRSVVVRCVFGNNTLLFMGDATTETEDFLRTRYPAGAGDLLDVQLLRVGHHGSETSTSQAFVDRVRPAFAVISSSRLNGYGLPRTAVVNRLLAAGLSAAPPHTIGSYVGSGRRPNLPDEQDCGVWLWETGWNGTLTIHFDGQDTPW